MSIMINGAKYAIATVLAAPVAITAVTNASPPSATAASPPTAGDILLLSSGWGDLDEAVVRAGTVTGSAFLMPPYDATDLVRFPATEGVGAYQLATTFINLPKIHDIQVAGGDQQSATRQYVGDPTGKQVAAPTFKNARTLTYLLDYDDSKPHFAAMIDLDRTKKIVVMRETLPNGTIFYTPGRVAFNKEPTRTMNEFISNALTFFPTADSVRYAGT